MSLQKLTPHISLCRITRQTASSQTATTILGNLITLSYLITFLYLDTFLCLINVSSSITFFTWLPFHVWFTFHIQWHFYTWINLLIDFDNFLSKITFCDCFNIWLHFYICLPSFTFDCYLSPFPISSPYSFMSWHNMFSCYNMFLPLWRWSHIYFSIIFELTCAHKILTSVTFRYQLHWAPIWGLWHPV